MTRYWKRYQRELLLLGLSTGVLVSIYSAFVYLSYRHEGIIHQLQALQKEVRHHQTVHALLQRAARALKTPSRPEVIALLKTLAQKYHLQNFHYHFFPEQPVHQDETLCIKKIPIRLQFVTRLDDNIWQFLKELDQLFPGLFTSDILMVEKQTQASSSIPPIILKGLYIFEWYILISSPSSS